MNKQITHITISTLERNKKLGEIVFFDPLGNRTQPLDQKKESAFFITHTLLQKGQNLFKQIFFKNVKPFLFSKGSANEERKCKTIISLFLSQQNLADYYLTEEEKRSSFVQAVEQAAKEMGYLFPAIYMDSKEGVIAQLTTMEGESRSLLEDEKALQRSLFMLGRRERDRLLFLLLKHLERTAVTSVVEVVRSGHSTNLMMTTHHGRTEIAEVDLGAQKLFCVRQKDKSKPHFPFYRHHLSHQHFIMEEGLLCAFCGNMETTKKVLEQILFLLDHDATHPIWLEKKGDTTELFSLCCTSFYSWHELDLIMAEKQAIAALDGQLLYFTNKEGKACALRLDLLHYNISLANWYEPKETKAVLRDGNDETLLHLTLRLARRYGVKNDLFLEMETLFSFEKKGEEGVRQFYQDKARILTAIDFFRKNQDEILLCFREAGCIEADMMEQLFFSMGKKGCEMDQILYLHGVLEGLGILHNHNSNQITKLLSSAAAIKAARGFKKLEGRPFLPCMASEEEVQLFELLYSIYLALDEPKREAALAGGYLDEESFFSAIFNNRQLSHYLSSSMFKLLSI